jgi:hypothetical protein
MGDELLAPTDVEEALSEAYVTAIAAAAGYVTAQRNFDRDGIDLTVEAGDHLRPKIDLQLKATINLDVSQETISYSLKRGNYDQLRIATQVPRLLVLLHLPTARVDWLTVSSTEMVLRYCAYWVSLRGAPETDVKYEKTVYIPRANRFDIPGLASLMAQSRTGTIV